MIEYVVLAFLYVLIAYAGLTLIIESSTNKIKSDA